jgi:hypothetical protein
MQPLPLLITKTLIDQSGAPVGAVPPTRSQLCSNGIQTVAAVSHQKTADDLLNTQFDCHG